MKILLVEDDITLLEMLNYNLTKQGYEVLTATEGRTALKMALEQSLIWYC